MKPTKTTTPLRDRCLSHCATLGIPLEGASLDELLSRAEKESLSLAAGYFAPASRHCRSQIESSYPSQVESSGFEGRIETLMVCSHSRAGVAPGAVAQSRGDGVGSGSNRYEAPPTAIKIRVVLTGRREGPFRLG
jgi:hypothetical protein